MYSSIDVIHILRGICKENVCSWNRGETVGKLVKNLEMFWMINKTIS